jgi:DNA-binding NtrC family response regulator
LAVGVIELPPLRERKDDLEALIDELLQQSYEAAKKHPDFQDAQAKKLSPRAKKWLTEQAWPGNIRQLKNTIDRAVLWCDGDVIEEKDIAEYLDTKASAKLPELVVLSPSDQVDLNQVVNDIKDKYCQAALNACGGVKSRAAKMLGFASHHAMDTPIKLSKKK